MKGTSMPARNLFFRVVVSYIVFFPWMAQANSFDNWCFPATACMGELSPIEGSGYDTCESRCRMKNPVNVNGMDAILYDVTCEGDWGSSTERKFFMNYKDVNDTDHALVVETDGAVELLRCK